MGEQSIVSAMDRPLVQPWWRVEPKEALENVQDELDYNVPVIGALVGIPLIERYRSKPKPTS